MAKPIRIMPEAPGLPDSSRNSCVAVHRSDDDRWPLPIVADRGRAWAVIWPGMGAQCRSLHRISLSPRGGTVPLRHPGEAVYYVLAGHGAARGSDGSAHRIAEGSMIHIGPQAEYRFAAEDEVLDVIGGPCPADPKLYAAGAGSRPASPSTPGPGRLRVFHRDDPGVQVPLISRDARLIVWLGIGAETANMNFVRLAPGEGNIPHVHPESEDTIYILSGRGTVVDFDHDLHLGFGAGDVIHVPIGIKHAVFADCGQAVASVGGPSPADRHMLRAAGLLA
jgi:quercetin dioxygenase-like cupin family protein